VGHENVFIRLEVFVKMEAQRQRPTAQQSKLAVLLVTEPELTQAEAMRRAGYSEKTALHAAGRIVHAPGTQTAVASQRHAYRQRLAELLPPHRAAERLAQLIDSPNPFVALHALERALQHLGLVEDRDRKQVLRFAFDLALQRLVPLVMEFVPAERRTEFARRVTEVFQLDAAGEVPKEGSAEGLPPR
jgi:hypothetical protein